MTNKIVLANAQYDMPNDAFSCDVRAQIEGETFLCGTFQIFSDGGVQRAELAIAEGEMTRLIENFPIANHVSLLALVASAIESARAPEDETYMDTFDNVGPLRVWSPA